MHICTAEGKFLTFCGPLVEGFQRYGSGIFPVRTTSPAGLQFTASAVTIVIRPNPIQMN